MCLVHSQFVTIEDNSYRDHLDLARSRPVQLSDNRCDSSSAQAGVLVAITGQGPTPPEGGTHYHRQRARLSYYSTHQGSETPLIYPAASHPRTRGAPLWATIENKSFG
ncbi:hypothetical protein AVEN_255735-1 [Araneus ventricosus]|uniref:Uncharacterized protein n=1 Tax=Araneus ventricosus TaxID=182803 RepID=A0A4Y2HAK8_ARAVE|nr:hypothetical protein AVEN_255735-1 [Araneus ventricosus]